MCGGSCLTSVLNRWPQQCDLKQQHVLSHSSGGQNEGDNRAGSFWRLQGEYPRPLPASGVKDSVWYPGLEDSSTPSLPLSHTCHSLSFLSFYLLNLFLLINLPFCRGLNSGPCGCQAGIYRLSLTLSYLSDGVSHLWLSLPGFQSSYAHFLHNWDDRHTAPHPAYWLR